jgi:hypothetical protein
VLKKEDTKFTQIRYTDVPGRFLAKYVAQHKEEEIESLTNMAKALMAHL